MQGWVPVPGSSKGDIALLAVEAFGEHGYDAVSVVDLAARAGVTTGSLYHHFGSKLGLYDLVRSDIERRITDRMEGALQSERGKDRSEGLRAALRVAFDAAIDLRAARLLSEQHPERPADPIEATLAGSARGKDVLRARLLIAAWRAALGEVLDGTDRGKVRAALTELVG